MIAPNSQRGKELAMYAYNAFSTEYGRLLVEAYLSASDVGVVGSSVMVILRMALLMSIMTIDISSKCMVKIIVNIVTDMVERPLRLGGKISRRHQSRVFYKKLTVKFFPLLLHI